MPKLRKEVETAVYRFAALQMWDKLEERFRLFWEGFRYGLCIGEKCKWQIEPGYPAQIK